MLHEQNTRNGNFLSVKHGAICLESKEAKDGYELIEGEVNGNPYSKYIRKFRGVTALVVGIEWYSRESGGNNYRGLHLKLKDGGERYILDLPFEKRSYDYFTKIAENIDYAKPVTFEAWPDVKNAKPGQQIPTAFVAKQDDQYVQWKYTRDNMGECPEAHQTRTGKWNFDDQRDWLLERIVNIVAPKVAALHAFDEPEPDYTGQGDAYEGPEMPAYTGDEPEFVQEAANASR